VKKAKKRGRPPTGHRYPVAAFLTRAAHRAVEKLAQDEKISRSEAVRRLIDLGIKARGSPNSEDH